MLAGFRPPEQYLQGAGHGAVLLSNSVALCDLPRLRAALEAHKDKGNAREGIRPNEAFHTQLLITKVFLARCAQEKPPRTQGEEKPGAPAALEPSPLPLAAMNGAPREHCPSPLPPAACPCARHVSANPSPPRPCPPRTPA